MEREVAFVAVLACLLVNCISTLGVVRDDGLNSIQRKFQLALIWCLPVLGVALVYVLRRLTSSAPERGVSVPHSIDNSIDLAVTNQMEHGGSDIGHHG